MKKRAFKLIAAAAMLLAAVLCFTQCIPELSEPEPLSAKDELQVYFLDVGQADSAVVLCGDEAMLIDAGNKDDAETVTAFLKENGIKKLKYAVGTHPHEDHIGAMWSVLENVDVSTLLIPDRETDTACYENMIRSADENDTKIAYPELYDTYYLGDCVIEVVGPTEEYEDINNTSLVLQLTFGTTKMLFTGDAERESEKSMLNMDTLEDIDLLKVGHHGSNNSSSYVFLRCVMPEYAIISVGAGNDYGHPGEDTMSRLNDCGAEVWRTDKLGAITVISDGKDINIYNEKGEKPEYPQPNDHILPGAYIGNIKTKKLHAADCSSLPEEKNRVYFEDIEQAKKEGYTLHLTCIKQ